MRKAACLVPILGLMLANTSLVADVWDRDSQMEDDNTATDNELVHGMVQVHDLAVDPGGLVVDEDWYRLATLPYSSYEILAEGLTGDLYLTPLPLDRIASDGTTVLGSGAALPGGLGATRTLRWANPTASSLTEWVRVSGANSSCTTACTTDDQYTIRFYETTASIPRFNNTGSQITVVLLQNVATQPVSGTIFYWSTLGALVASQPFTLNPKSLLVSNTVSQTGNVSGSTTIAHDGRYGDLQGKSVALEPATGFSFDTPLAYRPH